MGPCCPLSDIANKKSLLSLSRGELSLKWGRRVGTGPVSAEGGLVVRPPLGDVVKGWGFCSFYLVPFVLIRHVIFSPL